MERDIRELFRGGIESYGSRVQAVGPGQWSAPTPCAEWDVRDLVNHLVGEMWWVPPLLEGKTVADVGDRLDGDLVGDDPKSAWDKASREAEAAVGSLPSLDQIVHLSFGDFPAQEYLSQVFADLLIHGWDLARGIGADEIGRASCRERV